MALASAHKLACASHKGGGFGFISTSYKSPKWFQEELISARKELSLPTERLPIGSGYLLWELDTKPEDAQVILDLGCSHTSAIWLSFGASLRKWLSFVQNHKDASQITTFVLVSTVAEALEAAALKAHVLVAQGIDTLI